MFRLHQSLACVALPSSISPGGLATKLIPDHRPAAGPHLVVAGLLFCTALVAVPAQAHHGKGFLLVEETETPEPRGTFLIADSSLHRIGGESFASFSPAVLVGMTGRLAGELHGHLDHEPGEGWAYEATALAARVRVFESGAFSFGAGVEYELGHGESPDSFEARVLFDHPFRAVTVSVNGIIA
jgi:hypothetical protein